MPLSDDISHETRPPPTTSRPIPQSSSTTIATLNHHTADDAPHQIAAGSVPPRQTRPLSRRISSGESHITGQSDPKSWFDRSNQNPTATFDNSAMEVDPPFFQKGLDSSEDKPFGYDLPSLPTKRTAAHSSSADDYRSVIDDLTVEIQRLKEELKRYKQPGPDMLRKEKLFEIKFHGLPQKKKRELEATLRDFAASLQSSPDNSSSQRKKSSRRSTPRDIDYTGSGSLFKHASSSSGSNFRPADSAYASMSTGAKSSGLPHNRHVRNSRASNEKKVENYLRDIPEGLYPRHMVMTEKELKKLVVRRLEQLFTGKLGGRRPQQNQPAIQDPKSTQTPTSANLPLPPPAVNRQSSTDLPEPSREAKILSLEQTGHSGKKSKSRDNGSISNSHGDTIESGGSGNNIAPGPSAPSALMPPPLEQRPTRPRDLDPDRVQVPSENMDYIRHLGLAPPELAKTQQQIIHDDDVHSDEDGWIYLNLLCNLAQLHIISVTPDFVRSAVAGMSTKFQLSADGHKIRWRGGTENTKFSSDNSGYNSQKSLSTDESDDSKKPHKRQKTSRLTGENTQSGGSTQHTSKFGQNSSSESFHYKPIFPQRDSSSSTPSMGETLSSFGPPEDSNMEDSRWDMSGSGTSNRRKRRHDGAIIYYSGAPFCTDLSGDTGDISPSQILSASQNTQDSQLSLPYLPPKRTASGSFVNYRPLSDAGHFLLAKHGMDVDLDNQVTSDDADDSSDVELDLSWSKEDQYIKLHPLEPCGLGGVLPDDHFLVVVTTKRPKQDAEIFGQQRQNSTLEEPTNSIIRRLATMPASLLDLRSPKAPPKVKSPQPIEVEYVHGAIKWLSPIPLPPPALFFPPFSDDGSSSSDSLVSEDIETESSEESRSGRVNLHLPGGFLGPISLSGAGENSDDQEDSFEDRNMDDIDTADNTQFLPNRGQVSIRRRTNSTAADTNIPGDEGTNAFIERKPSGDDSSAATAGGAESGYSSEEESG